MAKQFAHITSGLGDVAIFRVTSARTGADQRYEDEDLSDPRDISSSGYIAG